MPSSTKKYPNKSEANRRKWADPEYRAKMSKKISEAKKKWAAEHKNDPAFIEQMRRASAARHKKYDNDKKFRKRASERRKQYIKDHPEVREKSRELALQNPFFNGERNAEAGSIWTEESRENARKRIIKYNKSRAGRKMASKRQKAYFKDPANRQKMSDFRKNEPKDSNVNKARIKHGYTTFQKTNQERHQKALKKHAIERAREMYQTGNVKPIIKPLPNQPDEYYDRLDDFFCEGF